MVYSVLWTLHGLLQSHRSETQFHFPSLTLSSKFPRDPHDLFSGLLGSSSSLVLFLFSHWPLALTFLFDFLCVKLFSVSDKRLGSLFLCKHWDSPSLPFSYLSRAITLPLKGTYGVRGGLERWSGVPGALGCSFHSCRVDHKGRSSSF